MRENAELSNEQRYVLTDEQNHFLALDNFMRKKFYPFSPFFNLLDLDVPLKVSKAATMSSPVTASASEWLTIQQRENPML